MGNHLYLICCFSLVVFNILFIFESCHFDNNVSWYLPAWVSPLWDSLHFLDLGNYLFPCQGSLGLLSLQIFSQALSLCSFWDPCNANVSVLDVVSQAILTSFHSFFFFLFSGSDFHCSVFLLTGLLLCVIQSTIDSFCCIFHFSYCILIFCLLYLFSNSLLKKPLISSAMHSFSYVL